MKRLTLIVLFIFTINSCNERVQDFQKLKPTLFDFVNAIESNWTKSNNMEVRKFPYINFSYNSIRQESPPYFLDKRQLLKIDQKLHDKLIFLLKDGGIEEVHFYNLKTIKFVLSKDNNLFRDKTLAYLYCKENCEQFAGSQFLEEDWYMSTEKVSH